MEFDEGDSVIEANTSPRKNLNVREKETLSTRYNKQKFNGGLLTNFTRSVFRNVKYFRYTSSTRCEGGYSKGIR